MNLIGKEITVLGAGIGGLAAARALALRGALVTVVEQAPEVSEVGAGLQISPNGGVVFEALGLGEAFRGVSIASDGAVLRDYARGSEILKLDLSSFGRFGLVHRADLIGILETAAREAGVQLELGVQVLSVELGDRRPVLSIDGEGPRQVEFLVGADGLHSRLRAALLTETAPAFTGQVAWRALLPIVQGSVPNRAQVFLGRGKHLVAYPLRSGTVLNIVGVQERDEWAAEGWNHAGDPEEFRRVFGDFGAPVRDWLRRVEAVNVWGLFRHPVAPKWFGSQAALLGDAAHPTLPFLAQGACLALEDSWVLAEALSHHDSLEAALSWYQQMRRARSVKTVDAATANARNYHLRRSPVRMLAHAGLRVIGQAAPSFMPDRFAWLYDHDVTRGAQ